LLRNSLLADSPNGVVTCSDASSESSRSRA
jgi:hypothetical protein